MAAQADRRGQTGSAGAIMKWIVLCNGGANDTTVGTECNSLGQACGTLEAMMKNLGATVGQIQKQEEQTKLKDGFFVDKEEHTRANKEQTMKPEPKANNMKRSHPTEAQKKISLEYYNKHGNAIDAKTVAQDIIKNRLNIDKN
jgi:Sec-independent protein translocase protein TatA